MANQINLGNMSGWGNSDWVRKARVGFAAALVALVSACGGGGVSAPTVVGGDLQVLPGTTDMFANTPVTFSISGGQRPYTVFSSNSSVLPLNLTVSSGTTFTATANNPSADTPVTVTVRDSQGKTATATANVKASTLLNQITISPSTNSGNACGGAQVCSGSEALASVRAQANGGPLVNRAIRFDIVNGSLGIVSGGNVLTSLTVNTDSNGFAIITLRAPVSVPSGYTTLRATDVTSSQNISYVLTVGQTIDSTAIAITPNNFQWTGAFKDGCASGALTSHLVTGGTPPYTVRQSIPDFAIMVGSPLAPASVPVPANGTTLGISGGSVLVTVTGLTCSTGANGNTITVTDAIGRVATFNIGNTIGTADRPTTPTAPALPVPVLTPNTFTGLACGVSFSSFVSQTIPDGYTGTAPVLTATALEPTRINAQLNNGILTMTRLNTDAGGGGQTRVRVSNGVNFTDAVIDLTGTAPFSCAGAGGAQATPISIATGTSLTLVRPAALPGVSVATSFDGGSGPYTIAVAAGGLAEISADGATYAQSITIAAGAPRVYFARSLQTAAGQSGGVTFITIRDSSTTQQTLVQIVTLQ